MDFRNVLIAIVLSTIVLVVWGSFFEAPIIEQKTTEKIITIFLSIRCFQM